jgi:hypothetical protein
MNPLGYVGAGLLAKTLEHSQQLLLDDPLPPANRRLQNGLFRVADEQILDCDDRTVQDIMCST